MEVDTQVPSAVLDAAIQQSAALAKVFIFIRLFKSLIYSRESCETLLMPWQLSKSKPD
jgi:hypothetical protein